MGSFGDALLDRQWRYRGLELGPGTPYKIMDSRGFYDAAVRDGDRLIPRNDGAFLGSHYQAPKEVILDFRIEGPTEDTRPTPVLVGYVDAFQAAFQRSQDEAFPLENNFTNEPQVFLNARVIRRTRPRRWSTELGIVEIAVRLKAADPRIYSSEMHTDTMAPYDPDGGGLSYPITYSKNYSASLGGGGEIVVENAGDSDAYPIFRVYGDPTAGLVDGFEITNVDTGQVLEVSTSIAVGQILTADMEAVVNGSGATAIDLSGSSRYGDWVTPRTPLVLQPGNNRIRFEPGAGSTATDMVAVIDWRDTSL